MDEHIVVTGFGAITALGPNAGETWKALLSGRCGIRSPAGCEGGGTPLPPGSLVENLMASDLGIGQKDARIMHKSGLMLLAATREAFLDARLDERPVPAEQTGFYAGIGAIDALPDELQPALRRSLGPEGALTYERFFDDGYRMIHPLWPLSILNNIAFCQTAIHLGIKGENAVFSPYNDAGAQAVIEGVRALREGRARAAVVAGASEAVTPFSVTRAGFSGLATVPGTSPEAECRPFSNPASGTVLGEGCGALVLERGTDAHRRGVGFRARISGFGDSCEPDIRRCGPTAEAIQRSMETALTSARMGIKDLEVLAAHGDGTAGDLNEIDALKALGGLRSGPRVFSSKAALGNLLAGAPLVDAVLAIHMILEGRVPHTIHVNAADTGNHLPVVRGRPLEAPVGKVMINSRGPGGQAASLILEAGTRTE